jgi:hypothetical protein
MSGDAVLGKQVLSDPHSGSHLNCWLYESAAIRIPSGQGVPARRRFGKVSRKDLCSSA